MTYDPDMFSTDFMRFTMFLCDGNFSAFLCLHIQRTRFQFLNAEHLDVKIAQTGLSLAFRMAGFRERPNYRLLSKCTASERLPCWGPSGPISVSHRVYFTSKGHAVKVLARIINYSWKYILANGTYNYFNY